MKIVYIYALCDPHSLQIKYVGQSVDANARYDTHCRDEKNKGKLEWLKDLAELELKPVLHIICEVDEAHADQVERALIQAYATEKQPLVNLALMPKYPASVFGEPLKTGYEAMTEEEKKQRIEEYPDPMSLDDAADLAARFMPDLYPDKRKAKNCIRIASYRGVIPGALHREDSPNGRDIWRYEKQSLLEWLQRDLLVRKTKVKQMEERTRGQIPKQAKRKVKIAKKHPPIITLDEAASIALDLYPALYQDIEQAKSALRNSAQAREIPGAMKVKNARGFYVWICKRDDLLKWLQR